MATRIFLLDRSGSMESVLDDTIGGFNSFVREQVPYGGTLTLYTFSTNCTCEYRDVPIEKVPLLTRETYIPHGNTSLYDSMGIILKDYMGKEGSFVILTDGQENSSRKFTKSHVKDLIQMSKLDVMYVGVDIDSAVEMGIRNSVSYKPSKTPELFKLVSQSVSASVARQTQSQTEDSVCSTTANDSTNQQNTCPSVSSPHPCDHDVPDIASSSLCPYV